MLFIRYLISPILQWNHLPSWSSSVCINLGATSPCSFCSSCWCSQSSRINFWASSCSYFFNYWFLLFWFYVRLFFFWIFLLYCRFLLCHFFFWFLAVIVLSASTPTTSSNRNESCRSSWALTCSRNNYCRGIFIRAAWLKGELLHFMKTLEATMFGPLLFHTRFVIFVDVRWRFGFHL